MIKRINIKEYLAKCKMICFIKRLIGGQKYYLFSNLQPRADGLHVPFHAHEWRVKRVIRSLPLAYMINFFSLLLPH